ncbi:MAG: AtpZ/AtpI family protein [Fibrobacteres bacterium]|nr:AtpZ/AtpI family protein [Fibrobacterota bacterium]
MANTDPARWFSLGGEITALVLGSALAGYWLSEQFQSQWMLVVCSLGGVILALYRMVRSLTR